MKLTTSKWYYGIVINGQTVGLYETEKECREIMAELEEHKTTDSEIKEIVFMIKE